MGYALDVRASMAESVDRLIHKQSNDIVFSIQVVDRSFSAHVFSMIKSQGN